MILILGTQELEYSTQEVIDWLDYFKYPFLKLNGEELSNKKEYVLTIADDNPSTPLVTGIIDSQVSTINAIWNRRWNRYAALAKVKYIKDVELALRMHKQLARELAATTTAFFLSLKQKIWVDEPQFIQLSKIDTLMKAKTIGLKVPNTIITTSKKSLRAFLEKEKRIICKPIFEGESFAVDGQGYILYTKELKIEQLDNLSEQFFPSLFQTLLEKKVELRVFYLDGTCYSMAIFSQNNRQTSIDFREYDQKKPNRNVPFSLPKNISSKIKELMMELRLQTGSIDIILTKDNGYVFLEVNPIGQFGMVSHPCNYNLEKKLANYLIKKDGQSEKCH